MRKPDLLRAAIRALNPWCQTNPENMLVSVTEATIVATGEQSASWEYRYVIEVLLMDFPGNVDAITLPILNWARVNQPDLLFNPDVRREGIKMQAQLINTDELGNEITPVHDVLFSIRATEAIIVTQDSSGNPVTTHRDEPDYSALFGESGTAWDIVFRGTIADGGERDE